MKVSKTQFIIMEIDQLTAIRRGEKTVIVCKVGWDEDIKNDFVLLNTKECEGVYVENSETTYKTVNEISEEDIEGTNHNTLLDLKQNLSLVTKKRKTGNVLNLSDRVAFIKILNFIEGRAYEDPETGWNFTWDNPITWGINNLPIIG